MANRIGGGNRWRPPTISPERLRDSTPARGEGKGSVRPSDVFEKKSTNPFAKNTGPFVANTSPLAAASSAGKTVLSRLPAPLAEAVHQGFARAASRRLAEALPPELRSQLSPAQQEGVGQRILEGLPRALGAGLERAGVSASEAASLAAGALPNLENLLAGALPARSGALVSGIAEGPVGFLREAASLLGQNAPAALAEITADPVAFAGRLTEAIGGGARQFTGNVKEHLLGGLTEWTSEALGAAGIQVPTSFDAKSLVGVALQVLGVTGERLFDVAEAKLGEGTVETGRSGLQFLEKLATEGPAAGWKKLLGTLGGLKEKVVEGVADHILTEVVQKGVAKIAQFLNPAGAIVKAVQSIFDVVTFFGENAKQIGDVAQGQVLRAGDFAAGTAGWAAGQVESGLAKGTPPMIGFLSRLIGLGGVADRAGAVIQGVQQKVDSAIGEAVEIGGEAVQVAANWLLGQEAGLAGHLAAGRGNSTELTEALGSLLAGHGPLQGAGAGEVLGEGLQGILDALGAPDPSAALERLAEGGPGLAAEGEAVGELRESKNQMVGAVIKMMQQMFEAQLKLASQG